LVILKPYRAGEASGGALRDQPLFTRKHALGRLLGSDRAGLLISQSIDAPADVAFQHICRLGLEGIVSKKLGSRYEFGTIFTLAQDDQSQRTSAAAARTTGLARIGRGEGRHGHLRRCAPRANLAPPAFLEARHERLRRLAVPVAQSSEEAPDAQRHASHDPNGRCGGGDL
jgi:hypothetical protein